MRNLVLRERDKVNLVETDMVGRGTRLVSVTLASPPFPPIMVNFNSTSCSAVLVLIIVLVLAIVPIRLIFLHNLTILQMR